MKTLKIFLVAAALFLLERVFFARSFEIFSLSPWLMFTFCLTGAAVSDEAHTSIITAGLCGLAADMSGGGVAGSAMAAFALSASLVHYFAVRLFRDSIVVSIVAVFLFGLGGEMLYFLLNSGGVISFSAIAVFWSVALPLAAVNSVFALLMYPLAKRVFAGRRYV